MSISTTSPAPIAFPCALTEELFERWLNLPLKTDGFPSRREAYKRQSEEEKLRTRARVRRMYALRGCDMAVALEKAMTLAGNLYDQVEDILKLYGPNEAERVLRSAGVPVPDPKDICESYIGTDFADAHVACGKLLKRLKKFLGRLDELQYVLPNGDPEDPPAPASHLVVAPEGE